MKQKIKASFALEMWIFPFFVEVQMTSSHSFLFCLPFFLKLN